MDKKYIRYSISEPTLIIKHSTGVIYGEQVDGCACRYMEVEGYILPFSLTHEERNSIYFNPQWWYHQYGATTDFISKLIWKSQSDKETVYIGEIRENAYNGCLNHNFVKWKKFGIVSGFIEEVYEKINLKIKLDCPQYEAWLEFSSNEGDGILTWENCD